MFRRISISTQIICGFALALFLMTGLAFLAYSGVTQLVGLFKQYEVATSMALDVNSINKRLIRARINDMQYRAAPLPETAEAVRGELDALLEQKARFRQRLNGANAFSERLSAIRGEVAAYREAFDKSVSLQQQVTEAGENLGNTALGIKDAISQLNSAAFGRGSAATAYFASRVQENLMLAQFHTERFLATRSTNSFRAASKELSLAKSRTNDLAGSPQAAEFSEPIAAIASGLSAYETSLRAVQQLARAESQLREKTLDPTGLAIQDELQAITTEIAAEQTGLGTAGLDTAEKTQLRTMLTAIALIVVGIGLAIALAFTISRALNAFTNRMREVANGKFDIEIPERGLKTEIGRMSEALAVFRENGLARIEAEQNAETDRLERKREKREREAEKARDNAEIQKAVDTLAAALTQLAGGDLSARIDTVFPGSMERLRHDFNASLQRLSETMATIKENMASISCVSNELQAGADNLSKRTEQQAASLEEASAALHQITATVDNTTRNADEATTTARHARKSTETSARVVSDAVTAMGRIDQASREISNIIGVIDEIAFQTNLLALNAGVEAARAGDAGKGFAVVAQEVRELAQRSAKAAKEIKDLITNSASEVRNGVELVEATGQALGEINTHVTAVNTHIETIVEASREQAIGLKEISLSVQSLDRVTQQNAAMVEETTAAAHQLSGDSNSLHTLLGDFVMAPGGNAEDHYIDGLTNDRVTWQDDRDRHVHALAS